MACGAARVPILVRAEGGRLQREWGPSQIWEQTTPPKSVCPATGNVAIYIHSIWFFNIPCLLYHYSCHIVGFPRLYTCQVLF